jgi:tetratricopeptide (TPR) repeat protein
VRGVTEVWRAELDRGLRRLAEGDAAGAVDCFEAAYRRAPERPEVCFALGRERMRRGRLDEAEALLRAAWRASRASAAAGAALARCLGVLQKRWAEAHAVLEALERDDDPALLVIRGEIYLEEERPADARACFERAEALVGRRRRKAALRGAVRLGMARVMNLEGIALGREARLEEALFSFKRAFDLAPAWSGPLVNMGAVFAELRRPARARACYERALVLEPKNVVARYNLATLARERGDLASAEGEFRRLLTDDPDYPFGRLGLAEVLARRGRGDEAQTVLRAAIERDPKDVAAMCRLAVMLHEAGRVLEAAEMLRAAKDVDAAKAQGYLDRGR